MDRFYIEMRAEVTGNTLVGHAAIFNQTAKIGSHYERLTRSAFDEALVTSDARFLVNHDPSRLLGRQSTGTLKLATDDHGLAFEVDLPDTQTAHDVKELVRRGDLDGGSFGFLPGEDKWEKASDGLQLRTHTSIARLLDTSIVTYPAYDGTEVALRSITIPTRPPNGRSRLIKARHSIRGGCK